MRSNVLPNAGSGIETLIRSLVSHFAARGDEMHLIYLSDSVAPMPMPSGAVASISVLQLRSAPVRTVWRMRKLSHQIDPDVLHSHSYFQASFAPLPDGLPRRSGPSMRHIHTFVDQTRARNSKRAVRRWALRVTDSRVVCVSNAVAKSLPWSFHQEPLIIYNGVNTDDLPRPDGGATGRTIVAVGRLEHQKGYPRLLEAFSLLLQEVPDARLRIAGEGTQRRMLEQMIETLQMNSTVQMLGHVRDVSSLYRGARMLAFSSNYEGLGLSVVEALCCGCPAVSTPLDPVREIAALVPDGIRFADDFGAESFS